MRKLIGNEVLVHTSDLNIGPGIFTDTDEESVYLQLLGGGAIAVPKSNIIYLSSVAKAFETKKVNSPGLLDVGIIKNKVAVHVNGEFVASAELNQNVKLDEWNDGIARGIFSCHEVKEVLSGKTQKGIHYYPHERAVYITVEQEDCSTYISGNNDFSCVVSSPVVSNYMNPADMAARLNVVSGIKKPTIG